MVKIEKAGKVQKAGKAQGREPEKKKMNNERHRRGDYRMNSKIYIAPITINNICM